MRCMQLQQQPKRRYRRYYSAAEVLVEDLDELQTMTPSEIRRYSGD